MTIGENIKRNRLLKDMTLEELSQKVGVSRQTLSRYETGVINNIPSDKIEALALALGTTPGILMGWETQDSAPEKSTSKHKIEILARNLDELLQYDYDIIFDSMQNYCKITGTTWERMGFEKVKNGHTVKINTDKYLILYNEEHSPERINWTVGHEIGHIYFGHKDDGKKSEIETSCFTAQLITPESPIRKLAHEFGFLDFGWIYNNFFVSLQSSGNIIIVQQISQPRRTGLHRVAIKPIIDFNPRTRVGCDLPYYIMQMQIGPATITVTGPTLTYPHTAPYHG